MIESFEKTLNKYKNPNIGLVLYIYLFKRQNLK